MAWSQRKNADIDEGSGVINGKCSDVATEYIDRFYTRQIAPGKGVFPDDFDPVDQNACGLTDDDGVVRYFKYVAVATALPSVFAQNDALAIYSVYDEATWGTDAGTELLDASGVPMKGDVDGRASIPLTWDWSENGDKSAIMVIIGSSGCQWEIGRFTFTQSTEVSFQVAAGDEIIL
jgi:hypothetical protein